MKNASSTSVSPRKRTIFKIPVVAGRHIRSIHRFSSDRTRTTEKSCRALRACRWKFRKFHSRAKISYSNNVQRARVIPRLRKTLRSSRKQPNQQNHRDDWILQLSRALVAEGRRCASDITRFRLERKYFRPYFTSGVDRCAVTIHGDRRGPSIVPALRNPLITPTISVFSVTPSCATFRSVPRCSNCGDERHVLQTANEKNSTGARQRLVEGKVG